MKNICYLILLVIGFSSNLTAQDNSGFKYSTNTNNSTITITDYSGPDVATLVVPKYIDGKEVTRIKKILGQSVAYSVKHMYFPPNISFTNYNNTNQDQTSIVSGLIEEGTTLSTEFFPFYYSTAKIPNANLECIFAIINDENAYSAYKLCGNNNNLYRLGSISVKYQDQTTECIQMYNWSSLNDASEKLLVNQVRYEYFLAALNQHLINKNKNITDISEINLSNLYKEIGDNKTQYIITEFDPLSLLSSSATVKIDEYTIYNPTIEDLKDYHNPTIDISTTVKYSREDTKNWNSVCMPFDISESDFPEGTKIYTLSGGDNNGITLKREQGTVTAGTPCFIYSDASVWKLSLSKRTLSKSVVPATVEANGWQLIGSFKKETIGIGKYKITADGKNIGMTNDAEAATFPFRCYLIAPSAAGAAQRFDVNIVDEEEMSISNISEDNSHVEKSRFDLFGHPLENGNDARLIKGNVVIR